MNQPPDGRPPVFRTWRRLYAAVAVYLALLIALFFWFTRAFAPPGGGR